MQLREFFSAINTAVMNTSKSSLVELEKRMKTLAEIIKYAEQYQENRSFHLRYKKSSNPDDYLHKHETQLILYDGAKQILQKYNINLGSLNIEKSKNRYTNLSNEKKELQSLYINTKNQTLSMLKKEDSLKQYLFMETSDTITKNKHNTHNL